MKARIITLSNGRRVVKPARGRHTVIEKFALRGETVLVKLLTRLTAPEIRRAIDLEWKGLRRRFFLVRLTTRRFRLDRDEEIALILRNTVPRNDLRHARRHTPAQIESKLYEQWARLDAETDPRKRVSIKSYIHNIKRRLKERNEEFAAAQLEAARRGEQVEPSDHSHESIGDNEVCPLCKETVRKLI
jgi:hypothetical protein